MQGLRIESYIILKCLILNMNREVEVHRDTLMRLYHTLMRLYHI